MKSVFFVNKQDEEFLFLIVNNKKTTKPFRFILFVHIDFLCLYKIFITSSDKFLNGS